MKEKMRIEWDQRELEVDAHRYQSILEALLDLGIQVDHSCGGMGTCGTCRISIGDAEKLLGSRNEIESELAADRGFKVDERLACQNQLVPGLKMSK